jgi:hypothetical protein
VRIPLDYYRILGLPIQATAEQLRQAHRDRALQLPRREYSETAISIRKQLIDQAYSVLSDPRERQGYDEHLLETTYAQDDTMAMDPEESSTIDIPDDQLIGALLILQELGEYELVLKLGRPYLSSGSASLKDGRFGDPRMVLPDIVLTIALACLELGREQWQQGQYENAAEALETGQALLFREGLFVGVRGEIQSDLYKLRPYRILELLALPEENVAERHQGLLLLKDMLRERGGIDGNGNDQSGLSIDDFLRFIQQLRGYLLAEEQQALFEEEARRPSAVATYLAVYALLARGFAEQQPALIRRAKVMLLRLGSRQDVHLEQAVCALLLGQTEEASRVLELSQEYEPLAFIRENSQGAPDLLPGLCLYSERWLQDEVFPHFRDLSRQEASLKEYFADEQVQGYLEELPAEPETTQEYSFGQRGFSSQEMTHARSFSGRNGYSAEVGDRGSRTRVTAATMTADDADVAKLPPAERFSRVPPDNSGAGSELRSRTSARNGRRSRSDTRFHAPDSDGVPQRREKRKRRFGLFMILAGVTVAGLSGFMLFRSLQTVTGPGTRAADEQLLVQLDQPVLPIEEPAEVVSFSGEMNQQVAQKVLETWFNAKKAAMGKTYNTEPLAQILVDPKLTEWQQNSTGAKAENLSIEYEHAVKVDAVEVNPTDPNLATVNATVSETRKYFQSAQPSDAQSDQNMQFRYNLVRQNNQWRIKDWSRIGNNV